MFRGEAATKDCPHDSPVHRYTHCQVCFSIEVHDRPKIEQQKVSLVVKRLSQVFIDPTTSMWHSMSREVSSRTFENHNISDPIGERHGLEEIRGIFLDGLSIQ
jgi:hypothetical protein